MWVHSQVGASGLLSISACFHASQCRSAAALPPRLGMSRERRAAQTAAGRLIPVRTGRTGSTKHASLSPARWIVPTCADGRSVRKTAVVKGGRESTIDRVDIDTFVRDGYVAVRGA